LSGKVEKSAQFDALLPESIWNRSLLTGTQLRVECSQDRGGASGEIDLDFTHDAAPVVPLTFESMEAALEESNGVVPPPTTFTHSIKLKTRYVSGVPQILSIEESPAPQGHPEHGRWLVTVLKVVLGG